MDSISGRVGRTSYLADDAADCSHDPSDDFSSKLFGSRCHMSVDTLVVLGELCPSRSCIRGPAMKMSGQIAESSPRLKARIAGALWLIIIVTSVFAEFFERWKDQAGAVGDGN